MSGVIPVCIYKYIVTLRGKLTSLILILDEITYKDILKCLYLTHKAACWCDNWCGQQFLNSLSPL